MAEQEFTTEELENEIWKEIPGYEGYYSISNLGRVRINRNRKGYRAGDIKTTDPNYSGYVCVRLYRGTQIQRPRVHRLVANAFLGDCPKGQEINHLDGNKRNNRSTNLEYLTHRENVRHAWRLGLVVPRRGVTNNTAKLTEDTVLEIRRRYIAEKPQQRVLAREYNVCQRTIADIIHRRTWTHI